ncbi:hypothetical protein [Yersinia phage fHe-Yen9-04]|uniref:Uncharacterized protein n=2 Tax=Eneladusvirus Yen904 TaxID=2560849 RepID=A0A2C9CXB4_9CAUD|nr:hypothetical protein FDJ41_gp272 [Yersinia phage fHe-Yen9-04]SOK58549.1 hypothetical protein [Yersinia phage fHe-Yen9-04]SOK59085.1 hypothetical protein [Yersinia phage fHe-Yen9-03]VUE36318.1 hypothetical protein [Yersinia phage fHe-Yen9-04]
MAKAWHWIIKDDKTKIIDMVEFFENELEDARREIKQIGLIETIAQRLPAYHEQRFSQLQQVETVLEILEIEMRQLESEKFKHLLEHYKRALTSSDCKKYVDGDPEVVALSQLIADVSYIRNQLAGVVKSLEMKAFQINNIVRLRAAGIEDARID